MDRSHHYPFWRNIHALRVTEPCKLSKIYNNVDHSSLIALMKTGLRRGSYRIDEEEIVEVLQISNARNPAFVITMATLTCRVYHKFPRFITM